MLAALFKGFCRFLMYALIFTGLVWVLLGITPYETYTRSRTNIGRILGGMKGFSGKMQTTAGDMKDAADDQLKQAEARFHGRDLLIEKALTRIDGETGTKAAQ